jgi:hypothetical protein
VADQSEMSPRIAVGDSVAYTDSFLDRNSRYPSDMPTALGKVRALHYLDRGLILADIEWDRPGLPKRVNAKNLTTKKATVPAS